MHSALLLLGLLQSSADPGALTMSQWQRQTIYRQLQQNDEVSWEEAERREAAYQEQQFIEKFNNLVKALTDFGATYNEGGTIDVKKVEAVKKAWRELEKADSWFAGKKK